MPAGTRKKGSSKRDVQSKKSHGKQQTICDPNALKLDSQQNANGTLSEHVEDEDSRSYGKYCKRQICDNSARYDEPDGNDFKDKTRFQNFDDVSFCIEGDSYFQLKDERDWGFSNEKGERPVIDCDELASTLKCIPLHIALTIPKEYFMPQMVCRFEKQASQHQDLVSLQRKEIEKHIPTINIPTVSEKDNLIIKEDIHGESEKGNMCVKPILLSEKTENLIESLTSCLTLKDMQSAKAKEEISLASTYNSQHNNNAEDGNDELMFLLSLNVPMTSTVPMVHSDNASIDNWLDKLLEDK